MTKRERDQWLRLHRLWALGKATGAQMKRCRELDRKAAATPAAQQHRMSMGL